MMITKQLTGLMRLRSLGYHQGGFMWHPVTQGTGRNEQHKQAAVFHGVNSITLFDQKKSNFRWCLLSKQRVTSHLQWMCIHVYDDKLQVEV